MVVPALSHVPTWVPLVLLLGAIALFKVSTLPMRWPWRLLTWAGGAAALLGAAAISVTSRENYGVWRAFADMAASWPDLSQSLAWQAISQNLKTLPNYLSPVTDFAILVVALVAIGALIAFTPGQRWERFTRGALVGVIGGVVGALMTVAVVALGFGGEAHRAVLIGDPSQVRVLDGDTLMINETSIRLWGVDAPELGQSCLGRQPNCGESSRNALVNLVRDRMVRCHAQRSERGRRVESFGRPLMQCFVGQGDNETDLAERMILDGHAVAFRSTRNRAVSEAYEALENFQDGCTLRPEVWRRNDTARREWEAGNNPNVAPDDRIGCGDSPAP